MAVNRNFVVKNGLEVSQDLILANDTTRRIGIGSTTPEFTLDVRGGIGASTVYVSGIATINVGVVTTLQGTDLNYSGISTIANATGTNLNFSGVGTVNTLYGNSVEYKNLYADVGIVTFVNTTGVSTVGTEFNVGTSGTVFTAFVNSGVGSVGIGTEFPAYQLDIRSPVSTGTTALYVQGDVRITGDINVDDITFDQATVSYLNVTGFSTVADIFVSGVGSVTSYVGLITNLTGTNINYGGIGTIANLGGNNISYSGVGTINTLYGDGAEFNTIYSDVGIVTNITSTNLSVSGIATIGSASITDATLTSLIVSESTQLSGITTISAAKINTGIVTSLNVTGVTTLGTVQVSSGVITATSGIVTYYGDGSYLTGNARNLTATIGIGTSGGVVGYGVSFLDLRGAGVSTAYYDSTVGIATIIFEGGGGGSASIGIGSTPGDAFVGIITAGNLWYNTDIGRLFIYYQDTDSAQWVDAAPFNIGIVTSLITSLTLAPQTASNPSLSFIGDTTTGLFSPVSGQQTFVSTGASVLNINPSGINVTGIVTSTSTQTGVIISGNINSSGIVTAQDFDALSDINYKENINTVNNALIKVEQLRGVKFDWKESGTPSYGVIAQELEQVLPELVHGNDPKTVNYNGIIGVLIEAIKELKAEVEELKNTK